MLTRRELLAATPTLAWPLAARAQPADAPSADAQEAVLRHLRSGGGRVLLFRHALAPGTFDPPQFKLGDCSTQRNLDDEGRQQARRIGAWFTAWQLQPLRVRSSPWCRCMDTARLAFGERAEAWAALGSPRAGTEEVNARALRELTAALAAVVQRGAGFEVWVSHNFVFQGWLGQSAGSGEAVLLGLAPAGAPRVLGRLVTPG